VQRDAPAFLVDDLARDAIAGTRSREDRRRVVRRGRSPRLRESRHRLRARIDVLGQPDAHVVELAGRAVVPAVELAAQDEPGAEPRADRQEDEVVDAARDATPPFAERREVDVVLDRDRHVDPRRELVAEAVALEARDILRQRDLSRGVDGARHAEHDAVDELRCGVRGREQRT
jgi:hypothetical protein